MEKELVIALLSGLIAFFVVLRIIAYLNRIFNIEVHKFIGFIIGVLIIWGLYAKRNFFFGYNPIITGATVGTLLSFIWNIKDSGIVSAVLNTVISFRFLLWIFTVTAGIYKRSMGMILWNRYAKTVSGQDMVYVSACIIIIFAVGSVFLLFPQAFARRSRRKFGFSMVNKKVSRSRKIFIQILGMLMIFICSTLIIYAVDFIRLTLA